MKNDKDTDQLGLQRDPDEWKTGDEVGPGDFSFKNATSANKMELADLPNMDELPQIFAVGGRK